MLRRAEAVKERILATGISIPDFNSRRQRGFTLWEILVVVLIVIITVSAVVSSTSFGQGDAKLKLLGSDLGKLVHLLYQEAVFENRNYAISLTKAGYNVLEYDGENWVPSPQRFFQKIKLGESREANLIVNNLEVSAVAADEFIPHILILSSGEISPFEWQITDTNLNARMIVQGNLIGKVTVLGPVYLEDV